MSHASSSPIVLVDGSSYLFRAFHGLPPLTNSKGQDTGAIYGVISMLKSLINQYKPSHVAVVFDAKGKTFRDDIYPEYKAHRPPMPEALRSQIEPLHNIIRAMGLPLIVEEGVEADDVIGTLARQASAAGTPLIISTGDKDMAQLVDQHVTLVNTMTNQVLDVAGVQEKFGVGPELIIDLLALKGDKVDNIPGVPGVGDKSALALLNELGGIDAIYQSLDRVAELPIRGAKSVAEKLRQHEQEARISYQLATIKTDVALPFSLDTLMVGEADTATLSHWFSELEFKKWSSELSSETPKQQKAESVAVSFKRGDYMTLFTLEQLEQWIAKIEQAGAVSIDTETTSLDYMEAELVGISLCIQLGEAAYIPLAHDYLDAPEQLSREHVLQRLKPVLENETIRKLGQHNKYDKNVLANYGIQLKGLAFDTMLESYILNSTITRHDLDSLSEKYLAHKTVSFEDIAGKGAKQLTFNQIEIDKASQYACEDAEVTLALHQKLWKEIETIPSLAHLLTAVEIPLSDVLARMEQTGVLIDSQKLRQQSQDLARRIGELEKQVYSAAGETFNLNSTKQLQAILFDKLNLPIIKRTPKGAPSTAEEVLQELAYDYELPKLITEHRGLTKLKTTYTDKLPQMINQRSGRVHTSYHQAVTATGRLSSSEPNLQNIPIRNEEGRRVRQAFIARPDFKILAADYSQIELRIMAHLSKDKGLLDAFSQGKDIHSATAAEVFAVAVDEVSQEQRRRAKAINFGLIYGMSAFGLARQLSIPRDEAQRYMDIYFERYPGVLAFMSDTREQAKQQGYVETVLGRRLYLPDINASQAPRRKAAERAAINAPMQGTAADIIKKAMIDVDKWIAQECANDLFMVMQVHDELVFEVRESLAECLAKEVTTKMEQAVTLSVPLVVEAGIGTNWDEAH